jgi:thioredoxin 1
MAVFDTPITTNEQNLARVVGQTLPVALYLFSSRDKALEDALAQAAKEQAGKLLIARVDVSDNPGVPQKYGRPALPALLTFSGGNMLTKAEAVRPADVRPHLDCLLGRGPMPTAKPTQAASQRPTNGHGATVKITDDSFQKAVIQSELPVLVDFWAPWCGPCLSIAPYLDQMAGEFARRLTIAKLNVDENPRTSEQFTVRAIPTFITFKSGKLIRRQSGANPGLIRDMIQGVLSS